MAIRAERRRRARESSCIIYIHITVLFCTRARNDESRLIRRPFCCVILRWPFIEKRRRDLSTGRKCKIHGSTLSVTVCNIILHLYAVRRTSVLLHALHYYIVSIGFVSHTVGPTTRATTKLFEIQTFDSRRYLRTFGFYAAYCNFIIVIIKQSISVARNNISKFKNLKWRVVVIFSPPRPRCCCSSACAVRRRSDKKSLS